MRTGTYYLNNSGSKWVVYPKEKFLLVDTKHDYKKMRTVEYYEAFGNYTLYSVKYRGKRITVFPNEINSNNVVVCRVYNKDE